jgi:hypothetical protein
MAPSGGELDAIVVLLYKIGKSIEEKGGFAP